MTELHLDGMPIPLFRATPTKLNAWLDCPRRYRFSYLDRPSPPKGAPWAHSSFGASVHNALKAWMTGDRRTSEEARRLVALTWINEGYRDPEQSAEYRSRATDMVVRYVATLDPAEEPVGVERGVAARHDPLVIQGRVDRIDERDGELVVVDYKAGRGRLTRDDARGSLALALYAYAVSKMFRRPCRTVELHHLPTGEVHTFEHTDASLQRQLGRAVDIAIEARDAVDFPASPGPLCSTCDFHGVCPEGQAAATLRKPWERLDAAVTEVEAV